MNLTSAMFAEALADRTLYLVAALLVLIGLVRAFSPRARKRMRAAAVLLAVHLALIPVVAILRITRSSFEREAHFAALLIATLAGIFIAATLVFDLAGRLLHIGIPRILQDVLIGVSAVVSVFVLGARAGFDLAGLVATSAVLTAVIGLAFQDTLGNVIGGLALQMDDSISVGDWVKVGDVSGQVTDIRWRYTAIETRNWETVILPNSQLVKNQVVILGRRTGQPVRWRRWVYFNVDFRYSPTEVISAVMDALREVTIDNVAHTPEPNCVLMDLHDSYARYAVRYWLENLAVDDPTDSIIRTRVYFALKRMHIPLSMPAHAIFVTEESMERREHKTKQDLTHRLEALARVDLFAHLDDEDRQRLATSLHHVPFAAGETITRQGAVAHWLYMLLRGEAAVRIEDADGNEQEVAKLEPGQFFGEMSLLTGARRSATIVALTDVDCYRLDRAAFKELLDRRPEVADHLADVLAERRVTLEAAKENLDQAAQRERMNAMRHDLLHRIRNFFGSRDEPPDANVA
jgi:small-conductance mechanosensitive channel/CRP-like cAMP-binding protein